MSIPVKQTIQCPKCGADLSFTRWQSINTQMPFAIPDIISGKLFDVDCKKCGQHIHLNYPLLFNDMIHSVMIYYCSPDAVEETTDSVEKQLTRFGIRSRIVTSQEALREKVSIFNADLDDRAVEILKQVLLILAGDQLAGQNIQGVYFVPGEKPRVEVQLDNGGGHIPVDMSMYEKVLDMFTHVLTPESDKELFIDGAWASDVLTREPE